MPGPPKIKGSVIRDEPRMVHFTSFVSAEEVQHILQLCEGRWERSKVSSGKASELLGKDAGDSGAAGEEAVGSSRTSSGVHLRFDESHVIERIAARVASVAGCSLEQVEPLVALKYEPGQFFKMHHDGAMRPTTVFLYLSDVEEGAGGETHFPHLGFKVHPAEGTALMWHNRLPSGEADRRLNHEAMPITKGVKYAMNCFCNVLPQWDADHIVVRQRQDDEQLPAEQP